MKLADLVAAGAPELPEGWFYRVVDDYHIGFKVELRRPGRFWSTCLTHAWVRESEHDDALSAVVDACQRAHASRARMLEERERAAGVEAFVGDYDPRRKK